MRIRYSSAAFVIFLLGNLLLAQTPVNRSVLFDSGWKFHRGGALSAEKPDFNDSEWRRLDLPHDWSIEDLPGTDSPFNRDAISQVNGGFTTGGTGWYRKTFSVPEDQKGKRVIIQFDGVFQNAEVWLNGKFAGNHPYGYTAFWFDLTDKISFGRNNVIAVKVRNEGENSRWYTGSGIYRHVWIELSDPVHIAHWGVYVTTPEVTVSQAKINIKTKVENLSGKAADIKLITRIISPSGAEVSRIESDSRIENGVISDLDQNLIVKSPSLWSVETPLIYSAITEVYQNSVMKDSKETKFGIRTISFDVTNGFRLNGQQVKLRGGCLHHDNGPLGSSAYDRAEERRIELLKASGYNAVRTSHNPPSSSFLDACDRLGMLVMDETFDMWSEQKNPDDYNLYFDKWWQRDVESMIYRDRNHPSVIMWSIGNEIPNRHKPEVVKTAKMLADFIRSIEPSRPVTSAVNDLKPDKDPYFATLDIAGYNYAAGGDHGQASLYAEDHIRVPQRIMAGTESYPLEAFGAWMEVIDHPYVIGDFVWTAFDYIGEASIGWRGYWQEQSFYPWNLAFCGDIDICGWKRPQSYYRDVLWKENQLSLFVTPPSPSFDLNPNRQSWSKWHWYDAAASWNWEGNEGKPVEVNVYSSCEQVELFLNGKSLGKKPTDRNTKFMASWQVPYTQGVLKAVGYRGKKMVNSSQLTTAGEVSVIRMTADRQTIKANNQDLSYVTVELTDGDGILNPVAENLVSFEIKGPGTIVAVGNANPVSTESFQRNERKAWHGKCLVIIKSGKEQGEIILKATSASLSPAEIKIRTVEGAVTGSSANVSFNQLLTETSYTLPGEDLKILAEKILYKKTPQEDMYLYLLRPVLKDSRPVPAIVYFTGGGWTGGSVEAQIPNAAWFRDNGIIGITADYRVKSRHGTSPIECIADAKSAVRFVRAHAVELGIDPDRIIVAGGSAGGHLAACTVLEGGDEKGEDLSVSSKANGLVLHNPVLGEGFGKEFFDTHPEFSPISGVKTGWPPTVLSCGTKDSTTPYAAALKFTKLMKEAGNICELITVKDADHSCDWPVNNPNFIPVLTRMTEFLKEQKLIN